jgi:hypothetical protein
MTLEDERLLFFSEFGKALDEWARLEVHLYMIFFECLRAPNEQAGAVFYGLEGFRIRLKLTDRVLKVAITDPTLLNAWADLKTELRRKSVSRNELAHHEVLEDSSASPGRRLTLRPALLDPHDPSAFNDIGLHINELRQRQAIFRALSDRLKAFDTLIIAQLRTT